jgi:polysaccharide biosynthesis PFTS motif protein
MYFYSVNCEPFKRPYGYAKFSNFYYELMNWPHYIVWDEHQAEFIRATSPHGGHIDCAGTVWFSAGSKPVPLIAAPTAAVFDVQPVRDSFFQLLGIEFEYYVPANANAFLSDCYRALQHCKASMAFKRKREIGSLTHPKYAYFVDKLALMPGFVSVDASTSASLLIEKCDAVISMPFTSTALTAKALGKPSVYYDPLGMIQRDDRGAHGIPILQGPAELQSWLQAVLPSGRAS